MCVSPKISFAFPQKTREELERRAHQRTGELRDIQRARIILALADGLSPSAVARKEKVDVKTVRFWRTRFLYEGILGLNDRKRSGRPPKIPISVHYEVVGMACETPAAYGVPFRDVWTFKSLAEAIRACHPELKVFPPSTAWRILHRADLHPHKMELWLHSKDPDFQRKATEVCDLYTKSPPHNTIVLCVDEKTGMQALGRPFPVKMPARGRAGRKDYDYIRHGTRSLIAAFNPHTGEVFGKVGATRKGEDLIEFMESLAAHFPKVQIHIVWDNLNTHQDGPKGRWAAFNQRHQNRFHFHYTPIHASWVNQVESWFSILAKRILRHGVFDSVQELERKVLGFIEYWNAEAKHPFRWTFKGYPLETRAFSTA